MNSSRWSAFGIANSGIYTMLLVSAGLGTISLGGGNLGNIRVWQVFLLFFIIFALIKSLSKGVVSIKSLPLMFIISGYFVSVLVSGANAIDSSLWLKRLALVFAMLSLFIVFAQRSSLKEIDRARLIIIFSGVFFSALGFIEIYLYNFQIEIYNVIHSIDRTAGDSERALASYGILTRARGFFNEANEFSQYLLLPFGYALASIYFGQMRNGLRILYIGGASIIVLAQVASLSRGGFLGFGGQLIALFIVNKSCGRSVRKSKNNHLITLSALLIVLPSIFLLSSYIDVDFVGLVATIFDRFSTTSTEDDWSTKPRLATIYAGFSSAGAGLWNFLIGVGAGNLDVSNVREATTTNQFVDVLVETGVLGLVFYTGTILFLLWISYKFMRSQSSSYNKDALLCFGGAYLSFVGMLFGGMTYSTHSLFFFWLNAGLLAAACTIQIKDTERPLQVKTKR